MNNSPSSATRILDGLDTARLNRLTEEQRTLIVTIMARAAERSYRRGVQQGITIRENRPQAVHSDLHAWRYGVSGDLSPPLDGGLIETSVARLLAENRSLRCVGLGLGVW